MGRSAVSLKTVLFILIAIAASSVAATAVVYRDGPVDRVQDTDIRASLLLKKDTRELVAFSAITESRRFSDLVYDLDVTGPVKTVLPWAESVKIDPQGAYSFTWRIRLSFDALFSLEVTEPGADYSLKVISSRGLPLYTKTNSLTLPGERLNLPPGIYILEASSEGPLDFFKVEFTPAGKIFVEGPSGGNNPKKINLRIDPREARDFERLLAIARGSGDAGIVNMPGGRVRGTLFDGHDRVLGDVRVGLSGRTREHLEWFPSVDLRLSGGRSYLGMPSFKLYRLDTKSGIYEFVFMSVLEEMGFFVPRHELVELYVNTRRVGVYLLMENFSPATFTARRTSEGDVVGVDAKKFFFDYPYGAELDSRYLYKVKETGYERPGPAFFFSGDFLRRLDRSLLSKYLAFASVYYSAHGVGVDDLRFYHDPAANAFSPVPRDLNPGLWKIPDGYISYLTHAGWTMNNPQYTVWPLKGLYGNDHEFDRKRGVLSNMPAATGLSDMHPALVSFVSTAEGLSLAESWLRYFVTDNALREKILSRTMNTLESVLALDKGNPLLEEQFSRVKAQGVESLKALGEGGGLKRPGGGYYRGSSRLSDGTASPGFFSPSPFITDEKEFMEGLEEIRLVEERILGIISEKGIRLPEGAFSESPPGDGMNKPAPLKIKNDLHAQDVERDEKYDNVATSLGTLLMDSDTALLIFLVRNAQRAGPPYRVVMRDGVGAYEPLIDAPFRLDEASGAEKVTLDEILENRFAGGEDLRLLVFELTLGKDPLFYRLKTAGPGWFLFPPYMYLPARSTGVLAEGRKIPEGMVEAGDGFHIPEGAVVRLEGDIFLDDAQKGLFVHEGATVIMAPGSSLRVTGALHVSGTEKRPVRFLGEAEGASWKGIYVGGGGGGGGDRIKVVLKNAEFEGFGQFPRTEVSDLRLNGGITFYNADVYMEGVRIRGARGEDAINIIKSAARIRDTEITGSLSDAVDLDFSEAHIEGLRVMNTGGDGLDVSNSLVVCEGSLFENSRDKGLSVGEMSRVTVSGSVFRGNSMGIANKDQSVLEVRDTVFEANGVAVAEFIKKPYFGRPSSTLEGVSYKENKDRYKWLGFYSY